jgi:hypothetical protein
MKTTTAPIRPGRFTGFALAVTTALVLCAGSRAAESTDLAGADRVVFRGGKLLVFKGGESRALEQELKFPGGVTVLTNGTFAVKEGRPRAFKEGQTLSKDGRLLHADGSIETVFDHVAMRRGATFVVKDGESAPVRGEYRLGDGTRVRADGFVFFPDGRQRYLLDGEVLRLEGGAVAAVDTVTLKNGKVIMQKDGSMLTLERGRTMMMSEGTKVFGEGYLIKRDGTRVDLAEGQIILLEGVVRR